VKSLFSSRRFVITIFLTFAVVLAACERQLDQDGGEAETTPAAPVLTQPAQPTTDPALAPTTDPAAVPTTDPAAVPTTDPAAVPTADPNAGAQATAVPAAQTTHVVAAGETLFSIALQYNLTVEELAAANNLDPEGVLSPGQTLIIPAAGTTTAEPAADAGDETTTAQGERQHVVKAGENLFRIGLQYGFTVAELAAYNGITNPNYIYVGQVILIPPTTD
jgi:LysM repeat protein